VTHEVAQPRRFSQLESEYQEALAAFNRFITISPGQQQDLARTHGQEVSRIVSRFDALRMGRLMAYLRHRPPDDNAGHSILIYKLTDGEVETALYARPAEMVAANGPLTYVHDAPHR
jgi:hypothetical protein